MFHNTEPLAGTPVRFDVHRRDRLIAAAAFGAALAYATLRYNVFKGVPWADWPAIIVNKALAVSGIVLIAASGLRMLRGSGTARTLLTWGGGMTLAHVLLSVALLEPANFTKLYAGAKLSAAGGASVVLGTFAYVLLEVGARRSGEWSAESRRAVLLGLLAAAALHTATPAALGWFPVASWPGGMPPLTLVSVLAGLSPVGWWAVRRLENP